MWFYPIVGLLAVLLLIGGIVAGGVFTIVFVPLAVIAALTAVVGVAIFRGEEAKYGGGDGTSGERPSPLPHQQPSESGHHLARPGELTDARRARQ